MKIVSTSGKVEQELTTQEAYALAQSLHLAITMTSELPHYRALFHYIQSANEKLMHIVDDEIATENAQDTSSTAAPATDDTALHPLERASYEAYKRALQN